MTLHHLARDTKTADTPLLAPFPLCTRYINNLPPRLLEKCWMWKSCSPVAGVPYGGYLPAPLVVCTPPNSSRPLPTSPFCCYSNKIEGESYSYRATRTRCTSEQKALVIKLRTSSFRNSSDTTPKCSRDLLLYYLCPISLGSYEFLGMSLEFWVS